MTSSEEQEGNSNKRTKRTEESLELNLERVNKEIECVNQAIERVNQAIERVDQAIECVTQGITLVQNSLLSLTADDITRDIYIDKLKDLRKDKKILQKDKDSLRKDKDSLREERLIFLRQSGNNTHLDAVVDYFPYSLTCFSRPCTQRRCWA